MRSKSFGMTFEAQFRDRSSCGGKDGKKSEIELLKGKRATFLELGNETSEML